MVKSVVMNGVKSGKLENCENDEETMSQSAERLCKSIIRSLVKPSCFFVRGSRPIFLAPWSDAIHWLISYVIVSKKKEVS